MQHRYCVEQLTARCKIYVVIKNLLAVLLLYLVETLDKSYMFCQKEFASKLYRPHLDGQDCGDKWIWKWKNQLG